MDREFGSGSFGTWFSDEAGLPAYRYTCDQYQLPEELPLVNKDSVWATIGTTGARLETTAS